MERGGGEGGLRKRKWALSLQIIRVFNWNIGQKNMALFLSLFTREAPGCFCVCFRKESFFVLFSVTPESRPRFCSFHTTLEWRVDTRLQRFPRNVLLALLRHFSSHTLCRPALQSSFPHQSLAAHTMAGTMIQRRNRTRLCLISLFNIIHIEAL